MIKLPASETGQWSVTYNNDKLPDLSATRNLTFDKEGYLRLSKPTASFYSSADDADFQLPLYMAKGTTGAYYVVTEDATFYFFNADYAATQYDGTLTIGQDTATDSPINNATYQSGATFYGTNLVVVSTNDRKAYTNGLGVINSNAWTVNDISGQLSAFQDYPTCSFLSRSTLAIAYNNSVKQFNGSYVAGTTLSLPSDFLITSLAYNKGYIGITTVHKNDQRCLFAVWDGRTTEANYIVEVPSIASYSAVAYKGSFAFVSSIGTIYYWTGNDIIPLVQLPIYYTDADLGGTEPPVASIAAEGDLLYINLRSALAGAVDQDGRYYDDRMVGGIYTYDPAVGLYHRHAPSGKKVIVDTVATTSVNTSTDAITVAAAPDTGTPVVYSDVGGTAITGLTSGTWYYTIKVDSTTIKLATTYTNALAGTAIDLTGTGNSEQTFQFYEKSDFGQSYQTGVQGMIYLETKKFLSHDSYYQKIYYGANCSIDTTTEYDVGGFVVEATENRGYFITAKLQSSQIQDKWQKLYLKHSKLTSDLDKIVLKYRIIDNGPLTSIKDTSDGTITWSDENTFTTTDTQFANVSAGDEIEIIQGTGAGYLAHVSSISESSGTYTVNIDEDIKNLTASDTGRAIANNWTKLTTIDKDTVRNQDGYSEVPIGITSKMIQFKVELRGEDVEVEELLVMNTPIKPV